MNYKYPEVEKMGYKEIVAYLINRLEAAKVPTTDKDMEVAHRAGYLQGEQLELFENPEDAKKFSNEFNEALKDAVEEAAPEFARKLTDYLFKDEHNEPYVLEEGEKVISKGETT